MTAFDGKVRYPSPVPIIDPGVRAARSKWPQPRRAKSVHFMKWKPGLCRWPLWAETDPYEAKFYCGDPAQDGQSYCAEHQARSRNAGGRLYYEMKAVERDLKRGKF